MTVHNGIVNEKANEFRLHLYEAAAVLGYDPAEDDDALLDEVIADAYEAWGGDNRRYRVRARCRQWLSEPDKFSPFVDEVALERALSFDWPVIANLTPTERRELIGRLADMDDPWGYHATNAAKVGVVIGRGWGEWAYAVEDEAPDIEEFRSRRRHSFMQGSEQERTALQKAVGRELARREERAAA